MTNIAFSCRPTLDAFLHKTFYPEMEQLSKVQLNTFKREILLSLFHLRNKRQFKLNLQKVGIDNIKISKSVWVSTDSSQEVNGGITGSYELNVLYKPEVIKWLQGKPCFTTSALCKNSKAELKVLLPSDIAKMKRKVLKPYEDISIREIERIQNNVLKDSTIKRKIMWLASRKLDFISRYNRYDKFDWVQDFQLKITQVIRREYPFKTIPHIENCCKVAIHNYAMNLISRYTFSKRSRLVEDENGSAQTTFDIDDPQLEQETSCRYDVDDMEMNISLNKFKKLRTGRSYEEKAVLNLLCSQGNQNFEKWLHKHYGNEKLDLIGLQEKLGKEEYSQAIREYLNISTKKFNKIIGSIQADISLAL